MSDINKIVFDNNMGLNLLNMDIDNLEVGRYISNEGVESINSANFYNSEYIPVHALGIYRLQVSESVNYLSIMEYDSTKTFIKRTLYGSESEPAGSYVVHTVGENTAYILIGSNVDGYALTTKMILSLHWMLSEGPEEHPYEDYILPLSCNIHDYRIPPANNVEHMYFRGDGVWAVPTIRYVDYDTYLLVYLS